MDAIRKASLNSCSATPQKDPTAPSRTSQTNPLSSGPNTPLSTQYLASSGAKAKFYSPVRNQLMNPGHQTSSPVGFYPRSYPEGSGGDEGLESLQRSVDRGLSFMSFLSRSGSKSPGNCSKNSSGIFCRICHDGEGSERLISPCQCSGSVALVHRSCIEKWLSTANHDNCELCNHKYTISRHPRPFMTWLCEKQAVQDDQRNIVGDVICFFLLTPLAGISTYLCSTGASFYVQEKKSESIGLICLCVVLVLIYVVWVSLTIKYHLQIWFVWRERNQDIRLVEIGRPPVPRNQWRTQGDLNYQTVCEEEIVEETSQDVEIRFMESSATTPSTPSPQSTSSASQTSEFKISSRPRLTNSASSYYMEVNPIRPRPTNSASSYCLEVDTIRPKPTNSVSSYHLEVDPPRPQCHQDNVVEVDASKQTFSSFGREQTSVRDPRQQTPYSNLDSQVIHPPSPLPLKSAGIARAARSALASRSGRVRPTHPPPPPVRGVHTSVGKESNTTHRQETNTTHLSQPTANTVSVEGKVPLSPVVTERGSTPLTGSCPLARNDGVIYAEPSVVSQALIAVSSSPISQDVDVVEPRRTVSDHRSNLQSLINVQSLLPRGTRNKRLIDEEPTSSSVHGHVRYGSSPIRLPGMRETALRRSSFYFLKE